MSERIDVFLQYYRPHVSGVTNMAAELAEHAAANGYDVHVHSVAKRRENFDLDGVRVHTYKKTFAISRAVFSIQLLQAMWKLRKRPTGIAHVHMPYPEAFVLAALLPKRWYVVATYQCDAPKQGGTSSVIANLLDWSHKKIIRRSRFSVCSSYDYSQYTRLADTIRANNKRIVTVTSIDRAGGTPRFRVPGKRLVGFIGRPTHEKGVNVLFEAMTLLPDDVALLFAGPTSGLTEALGFDPALAERLQATGKMIPLGFLEQEEIADFYASLDVYAHTSINSFDAFGIVQLEAVSAGIPVVATDIPGVRTVVGRTGFGEISEAGNAKDLASCILKVLDGDYDATAAREIMEAEYLYPVPHNQYLELFDQITQRAQRNLAADSLD